MPPPTSDQEDALARALKYFDETKQQHGQFVNGVERRYKSYRGVLDGLSEAAEWTSKYHPPYINHIVETTLASLIDDQLSFTAKPRELITNEQERARLEQATRAQQALFDWQNSESGLSDEQRPFNLQHAIAGLTVAKTFWMTETETRRTLERNDTPILDPFSQQPLMDATGQPRVTTSYRQTTKPTIVYDGPVTETRDVRDFGWHQAATSLKTARYVWDRVWLDREDIEQAIDEGKFGPDRGGWSKADIVDALSGSRSFADGLDNREKELWNIDRTKDKIEVVEVWDNVRHEVVTFANRCVLLASREFPFWHRKAPFVVCSAQPDLFRIPGFSQVEKVEHLQEMLWLLASQRLDNLRLINAAIFMFRPDVDDIDDYKFEPGARWFVEDPTQVQMWSPNVIPAEVSLGTEAQIKGDMQDLAGGFPFTTGAQSQTVDNKTATGASIISGIAQRSIDLSKQEIYKAWKQVAKQRSTLNAQYIRTPTVAPIAGHDGTDDVMEILPEMLQAEMFWEADPEPSALRKQEEQASAQALLQMATSVAPILAAMSQGGVGKMVRLDVFMEDLLKSAGKSDTAKYFSATPSPPMPQAQPGQQSPGAQSGAGPSGQPLGVTAPSATDATSPSSQMSLSPEVMLQRAMALSNAGGGSTA